jgi:3-hydroxybutyryl-CoA dehydrogenase
MDEKIRIATAGLGLMGSSITTCFLAAGHPVTALEKYMAKADQAKEKILFFLNQLKSEGLLNEHPDALIKRLNITDDITLLADHSLVVECITEDISEKKKLFQQLENVLSPTAIIGSNTSAIPISLMQAGLKNPERFIGIHWGEPAHISRFLEVICGNQSDIKYAQRVVELSKGWSKEASLVKKDIRGFITNRLLYAMIREALYLVEHDYATIEDIDRSLKNNHGYWITFAGLFRFMDIAGIPAYLTVAKELFPELSNTAKPPAFFEDLVASGAKGVSNAKGFYAYTDDSAKKWEKLFVEFSYDIRKIALKYPDDAGDR